MEQSRSTFSVGSAMEEMNNLEMNNPEKSKFVGFSSKQAEAELNLSRPEATPANEAYAQESIQSFSTNDAQEQLPKEVVMTEDDWLNDSTFIQDAKTLQEELGLVQKSKPSSEYLESQQGIRIGPDAYPSIEELQAGMEAAQEGYVPDDSEYAEGLMSRLGNLNWNLPDLGLTAMGISDWSEEAQVALIRSMKRYDEMPLELRHVGRALGGVATDPSSYLGFTVFANALSKVALKGAATNLLKKAITAPTTVAAIEGAAYSAGDDVLRQAVDNKGDFSKNVSGETYEAAAYGLGIAGTIGFTLNKVFTPRVSKEADELPNNLLTEEITEELGDQAESLKIEAPTSKSDEPEPSKLDEPEPSPLEGELIDDGTGLPVKSDLAPEDNPVNGQLDSENNARDIPQNEIGEDWYHLRNGKKTLNTERLETTDDVKGFLESASSQIQAKRFGPPETLEESRRLADEEGLRFKEETGGDIKEILEQFKDDSEELQKIRLRAQKLRELNVSLGDRIVELADLDERTITNDEMAELIEKAALFANTMELGGLLSREFGRGLGNYRLIMSGDPMLAEGLATGTARGDAQALIKTIRQMKQAGQIKNGKAKNGKAKTDLKGLKASMRKGRLTGALQEVIRFRSAMMLSGPSTIEAAALSNITRLWSEPFWEWAGNVGFGSAKKKARVRAMAQWAGNKRYARDAFKLAARAWKNGQHISDPFVTKLEGQLDAPLQNMSALRRNVWERGVHQAHLALMFLDEGVKAGRSRSIIYADSVVEAAEKGIKNDAEFEHLLSINMKRKIDKKGRVVDAEVIREIRETTFTSDLEGPLGKVITDFANLFGGAGRLIVPFIRAPINILSEGLTYIPGSQVISFKQQRIAKEGSDVEKAKLKARRVVGTAAVIGLYYAAEEELITGSGPTDYKLRQALMAEGWRPNSIRIGGQWVSYAKLGPFSLLLGVVADVNYIMRRDNNESNATEESTKMLGLLTHVVANNILNKAYFSSVQQLMDAVSDPEQGKNVYDSFLLSFTPNVLAQMNKDPNVREANTIMEKFQRRIPEWSEKLGKQYDFYGREILKPKGDIPVMGYMFKNDKADSDPVAKEVFMLSDSLDRSILDKPRYNLGITNTDFRDVYDGDESESVYAKYNRFVGEATDSEGLNLHEALGRLFGSAGYLNAPHSIKGDITSPKVKMIKSVVNSYRGMAKGRLHDESPAFNGQVRERSDRIQSIFQ